MPEQEKISRRTIRAAGKRIHLLGVRKAVRELERQEPNLAEYVMERSTELYGGLDRACPSHRQVKVLHRQVVMLVLVSIEALRRSHEQQA